MGSISDTLAQMIEVIRARGKAAAKLKHGVLIGEIELDEKGGSPGWDSPRASSFAWTSAERPLEYDFPRLIRFMGFGFFWAPVSVLPMCSAYCSIRGLGFWIRIYLPMALDMLC